MIFLIKADIEKIDAAYKTFLDGASFQYLEGYLFELQTLANDALNPSKIEDYLTIVHKEYGEEATNTTQHYIIVVAAKYLQMMASFYTHENDPEAVERVFSVFNDNFHKYEEIYQTITGKHISFGTVKAHEMPVLK